MKKSAYYITLFRRRNVIKEALFAFFLSLCSWPRMLLEVPIRHNFGERYFKPSTAISIVVVLSVIPLFISGVLDGLYGEAGFPLFVRKFLTWYIYIVVFMHSASQRQEEIKRLPSVFDFAHFSLSTGVIHRWFREFEFNGRRFDIRTIETVLEPGVFFFIGLILMFSGQPVGYVLLISSIFYSFSYAAAYHDGDNFLMDKIDEHICNEELVRTFVEGTDSAHSRGFSFYGRRPANPDARRHIAAMFMDNAETVEAF